MPIWLMLLLTALPYIIKWLLSLDRDLNERELEKVNRVLQLTRQMEVAAVRRGATASDVVQGSPPLADVKTEVVPLLLAVLMTPFLALIWIAQKLGYGR